MLVTYLRSSSIGGWEWCSFKQYLVSNLGWDAGEAIKARKGTAVHKALELLARKKLALQNGHSSFEDEELASDFNVNISPAQAFQFAYDHYSRPEWTEKDKKDCKKWFNDTINWGNGQFNPLNQKIVAPELYFDFELPHEWAKYEYVLPDGSKLTGQLALKGTMDLLVEESPWILHYVDYKSGQRVKDWATRKKKEYDDFREDPQMMLYFYALKHLYPNHTIAITVFFCRDGGPYSVCFTNEDLPRIERMIRAKFEEIRDCQLPKKTSDRLFRCERANGGCQFFNTKHESGKTMCDWAHGELQTLGMDRMIATHGDLSKLSHYGSGGGRERK